MRTGIYYIPSVLSGYKVFILFGENPYGSKLRSGYNAIMLAQGIFTGPAVSDNPAMYRIFEYEQALSKPFDRLPRAKQKALAEHVGKYHSQQKRKVVRQIFKAS